MDVRIKDISKKNIDKVPFLVSKNLEDESLILKRYARNSKRTRLIIAKAFYEKYERQYCELIKESHRFDVTTMTDDFFFRFDHRAISEIRHARRNSKYNNILKSAREGTQFGFGRYTSSIMKNRVNIYIGRKRGNKK